MVPSYDQKTKKLTTKKQRLSISERKGFQRVPNGCLIFWHENRILHEISSPEPAGKV